MFANFYLKIPGYNRVRCGDLCARERRSSFIPHAQEAGKAGQACIGCTKVLVGDDGADGWRVRALRITEASSDLEAASLLRIRIANFNQQ